MKKLNKNQIQMLKRYLEYEIYERNFLNHSVTENGRKYIMNKEYQKETQKLQRIYDKL